jgi:hypothetical protein
VSEAREADMDCEDGRLDVSKGQNTCEDTTSVGKACVRLGYLGNR